MAMCGPSQQETIAQGSQQSLAMSMEADFQKRFAGQDQLLQNLNNSLTPIVAAGPEQQGFSASELAAKNTQAINSSAAANRNARQSAGNAIAGQNNSSGLESGIHRAIEAGIGSEAANQLASEQNNITQQNYDVGRSNYRTAVAGSQALAGQYDPTAFSSGAKSGLDSSFSMADRINTQQQAKGKAIAGGLSSLAKSALSFGTGGISNVLAGGANAGSGHSGGVGNFFSGGLDALMG